MIAYIDASVILRIVLNEPRPLSEWDEIEVGITSEIARVECLRTVERREIANIARPNLRHNILAVLSRIGLLPVTNEVLAMAAGPFPNPLGALDAIHLATAIVHRQSQPKDEPPIRFATHDSALAAAARVADFRVVGA